MPKLARIEKLDFIYQVIPQVDRSKCVKCGLCHLACRDAGYETIELKKLPIVKSAAAAVFALKPVQRRRYF